MTTQENPVPSKPGPCDQWHEGMASDLPDAMIAPEGQESPPSRWRGTPEWNAAWDASTASTWSSSGAPTPQPSPLPAGAPTATVTATASAPTLGVASFVIVTAMTVVCLVLAYLLGGDLGNLLVTAGGTTFDPTHLGQSSQRVSVRIVLGFLAAILGCGGWIMSVVAYNRRSARSLSLAAIIIGLIVPMLAFIALLIAAQPYVHQIPR